MDDVVQEVGMERIRDASAKLSLLDRVLGERDIAIIERDAAQAEVARLRHENDRLAADEYSYAALTGCRAEVARLRAERDEMYETLVRIADGDEGDPAWTANKCLERVDNTSQDAAGGE